MAETGKLQVRLVTPDRILVNEPADAVEVPSRTGYLEVLFGAAPLLAELGAGEVTIHGGQGGDHRFLVARGFVEVLPERVTILAELAEAPNEIDRPAAEQQLRRGEQMWQQAGEDASAYEAANEVMAEAQAKLDAASRRV
jgi:F-type H+-transporting ATPase subunit epsilon